MVCCSTNVMMYCTEARTVFWVSNIGSTRDTCVVDNNIKLLIFEINLDSILNQAIAILLIIIFNLNCFN